MTIDYKILFLKFQLGKTQSGEGDEDERVKQPFLRCNGK